MSSSAAYFAVAEEGQVKIGVPNNGGSKVTIDNTVQLTPNVRASVPKEVDPHGLAAHTPGAKMDAGKAPIMQGVIQYFPRALRAVSMVSLAGATKYAWKGWEKVPDGINRYDNALGRHLLAEAIEGPVDKDTQCLHKAQVAWNALASLELYLREQEKGV